MNNKIQKSNLAKLLATENIQVEHNKVVTAQFDVKNRILTLPIWKKMSNDLYDMLVGHEVGHALFTPDFSKKQYKRVEKIPHSYLNILEDIRIDKKIKEKYPGLKKSYYRGQSELRERGFFGDEDRPLDTYKFIDRLNIHAKNGSLTPVQFSEEEDIFVKEAMKTETFEDVINLAEKITGYAKNEKTPKYEPETADNDINFGDEEKEKLIDNTSSDDVNEENENGNQDQESESKNEQEESDKKDTSASGSGKDESGEEETKQEEKQKNKIGSDAGYDPNNLENQFGAETDKSLNENIKSFLDNTAKTNFYMNLPEPNLNGDNIVSADWILNSMNLHYKNEKHSCEKNDFNTYAEKEYLKFKKENNPVVQYMVKEFEMKKAADDYKRATTSKTGIINVNKLHAYNYIDDIFKKMTVLPGAKNHGLMIVLDHSGSMHQHMYDTMTQLFNLTFFCKQVGIPFEVYSFSDINMKRFIKTGEDHSTAYKTDMYGKALDVNTYQNAFIYKVGDKVNDHVSMLNWVSSKQNTKQYNQAMLNLYKVALSYKQQWYGWRHRHMVDPQERIPYYQAPNWTRLGGTPLNSAIVVTAALVKQFQKKYSIQKMNTVFLTDGASHDNFNYVEKNGNQLTEQCTDYRHNIIIRDTKNKIEIKRNGYRDITTEYLKWFRIVTGSKLVGFFLYGNKLGVWDRDSFFGIDGFSEYEKQRKLSLKSKVMISKKAGYDKLFLIKAKNLHIENEELDVNGTMSVAQIKRNFGKSMKNKLTSRVLLNKFVDLVA